MSCLFQITVNSFLHRESDAIPYFKACVSCLVGNFASLGCSFPRSRVALVEQISKVVYSSPCNGWPLPHAGADTPWMKDAYWRSHVACRLYWRRWLMHVACQQTSDSGVKWTITVCVVLLNKLYCFMLRFGYMIKYILTLSDRQNIY
jgi:hypothetical protein